MTALPRLRAALAGVLRGAVVADALRELLAATLARDAAHDVGDTIPGEADAYRAEARGYVAQAVGMLGLTEAGDAR